jgi:hypothetical protein
MPAKKQSSSPSRFFILLFLLYSQETVFIFYLMIRDSFLEHIRHPNEKDSGLSSKERDGYDQKKLKA